MKDKWREVDRWFRAAQDQVPDRRVRFLEQRCLDTAVRAEVLEMLATDSVSSATPAGLPTALQAGIEGVQAEVQQWASPAGGPEHRMEQFGKYSLIRKIGTGGMGEVFLARTTVAQGLNKTLVIKKIHAAYARSRQFVAMFVDEAKIALGLNHPNIIRVFDFGAIADTYFLAMEYVEGVNLLQLLPKAARGRQRLPYGLSAYIVQQLAKGLDYAHRKTDEFGQPLRIVHRDISPQNILLSWDGGVKIIDFGIARARDVHEEEGVIKGKYAYMSPEQARGEVVDCRSDVFAAGIVLFELVCARPLFNGKGKEALEMVKSGAIPRPKDFAPELPESLERIILRALAFHRGDRFATARDLQQELGRFQLEWAQRTGAITDPSVLAQHLASLGLD